MPPDHVETNLLDHYGHRSTFWKVWFRENMIRPMFIHNKSNLVKHWLMDVVSGSWQQDLSQLSLKN